MCKTKTLSQSRRTDPSEKAKRKNRRNGTVRHLLKCMPCGRWAWTERHRRSPPPLPQGGQVSFLRLPHSCNEQVQALAREEVHRHCLTFTGALPVVFLQWPMAKHTVAEEFGSEQFVTSCTCRHAATKSTDTYGGQHMLV